VSDIGIDDEAAAGTVAFQVFGDGQLLYDSGVMNGTSATRTIDVDVQGRQQLQLVVTDGGDNVNSDHGDWAEARLLSQPATAVVTYLSDLPFAATPTNGWGPVERDASNGENAAGDGRTITLNGVTYAKGLGVHAQSSVSFELDGDYSRFMSDIGIDDEAAAGTVAFQVYGDDVLLYDSGVMNGTSATRSIDLDVEDLEELRLVVTDGGDNINSDHGDWAGARLLAESDGTPGNGGVSASVAGRYVFYNQSFFDGDNAAATGGDDAAIDPSKRALLPGGTGSFAHYTSYSRGLNGLMVDIDGPHGTITATDFAVKVGNNNSPATWTVGPSPTSVTLRAGAGVGGSDRYTLIWASGAIARQWAQITVLANANTGLTANDVFYFGNAIGEVGNSTANAIVSSGDEAAVRVNFTTGLGAVPVTSPYDINKDRFVQISDAALSRVNQTTAFTALRLIAAPADANSATLDAALASLSGDLTAGAAAQPSRRRRR
jgi:hypothetical protein